MESLIDTHAHLDFPEFQDLDAVLERAERAGVREIISIGIDLPSSRKAVELAAGRPRIYATVGIHPHDAFDIDPASESELRSLARNEKVVAVGEIGLDYFRDKKPRELQRRCLIRQLDLAVDAGLPAVFHIREAFGDFMEIIPPYAEKLKGAVLHCFSGDWAMAERCLAFGFYISIPGTVTFAKAANVRDVAARAPLDRLLVETDAPYLTPVPFRGKVNEPAHVRYTAAEIARLRGISPDETAKCTTENARRVFGLPVPASSKEGGQ